MAKNTSLHSILDSPAVLAVLFHPRREPKGWRPPKESSDHLIPMDDGVFLGARFHLVGTAAPNLLFFHGNGEIVADYDEIGQAYASAGINFLAVDYRGYGRSNGTPTASFLLTDSRQTLTWVRQWLRSEGQKGPLAVMGRSLGSAAALELAGKWPEAIGALIIESGFAHTGPLLATLGARKAAQALSVGEGFSQLVKIGNYAGPTLVIHAERDHLIPLENAKALYEASPSPNKEMLIIPGANHNDIFMRAWPDYLAAVTKRLKGMN